MRVCGGMLWNFKGVYFGVNKCVYGFCFCLVCELCFVCTFCVLFLCVLCLCVAFCSLVLFCLCFFYFVCLQVCAG